jgi:surface antigen
MVHGRAFRRGRGSSRSLRGKRRLPGAALRLPVLAVLAAGLTLVTGSGPASAAGPDLSQVASSLLCTGWSGCAGSGYASYAYSSQGYQSYWDMSAGDECTNYVAYVESQVFGAPTPDYLLGNGGQWAASAAAHGVVVNDVPSVGAVAEWNGGSYGMGPLGHVAVVEKVGPDDSYIYISQQNISSAPDGYEWVRINAGFAPSSWEEWPSNFIHFPVRGETSVGYYNASRGTVNLRGSLTGGAPDTSFRLSAPGMVALAGDWTGKSAGIGYYNPSNGTFHLRNTLRSGRSAVEFRFGPPGMIPLAGSWSGKGGDRVGYYDPRTGTFHLRNALSAGRPNFVFTFGPPGMIPLVGNWDGKGGDGVGYYDPRTRRFYLRNALSAGRPNFVFTFGPPGMVPLAGRWTGGRTSGIGVYDPRNGRFLLRSTLTRGPAGYSFRFGPRSMSPLAGEWLS